MTAVGFAGAASCRGPAIDDAVIIRWSNGRWGLGACRDGGADEVDLSRFAFDESGVTAIEYGLIASLASIVIIGVPISVGTSLRVTFTSVNTALQAN
jgi:pilus assembly protein Flp/PilA